MLLHVGQYDDKNMDRAADFMVQSVPGAQKVALEAAHLPNMEQPDAFNQALLDFLS